MKVSSPQYQYSTQVTSSHPSCRTNHNAIYCPIHVTAVRHFTFCNSHTGSDAGVISFCLFASRFSPIYALQLFTPDISQAHTHYVCLIWRKKTWSVFRTCLEHVTRLDDKTRVKIAPGFDSHIHWYPYLHGQTSGRGQCDEWNGKRSYTDTNRYKYGRTGIMLTVAGLQHIRFQTDKLAIRCEVSNTNIVN